jgi:hypothetical protein
MGFMENKSQAMKMLAALGPNRAGLFARSAA